jgi:hypothetical protein
MFYGYFSLEKMGRAIVSQNRVEAILRLQNLLQALLNSLHGFSTDQTGLPLEKNQFVFFFSTSSARTMLRRTNAHSAEMASPVSPLSTNTSGKELWRQCYKQKWAFYIGNKAKIRCQFFLAQNGNTQGLVGGVV